MTKRKDTILEILYHLCFVIYTTLSLVAFSQAINIFEGHITHKALLTVANWGAVAVLTIIYILKKHESKKEIAAELLIVALFAVTSITNQTVSNVYHLTQWTMFLVIGMFIVCATVTTFKRIAATSFLTTTLTFAAFSLASSIGFFRNVTSNHSGMTAHYMGYYYYSHPSYYMLFAWLAYMYLRGEKKIGWIELLAEAAALYMLHNYTTCRLANVCTFIALVLYIIVVKLDLLKLNWKIVRFGSVIGFGAAAIFTLLTGYFYNSGNVVLQKLDDILNTRLSLVNTAFNKYDLKLFGRLIIPYEDGSYFYLDSGYAYALFGCGIIFFIVVLFMYSYMCYYSSKTNDKHLFIWLVTLAIFGIVGDAWVHISYTPLILGFFIMWKDRKKIIIKSDDTNNTDNVLYQNGVLY